MSFLTLRVYWSSSSRMRSLSIPGLGKKLPSRPQRELQPGLRVEERDGALLALGAHHALGLQAKTIAVESHSSFPIINAKDAERDPRLHALPLP
jgi:hypothetical protein